MTELFEDLPVALLKEDFSDVKRYVDDLRKNGVEDFRDYFLSHQAALQELTSLIKISDVNRAALELYHAPDRDSLFNNLDRLLTEESRPCFLDLLLELIDGKYQFETQTINRDYHGEKFWIALRGFIPAAFRATWEEILIAAIDITPQKEAEQDLQNREQGYRNLYENFRSLFDGITDCLVVLSSDLKVTWANQTATRVCNRPLENIFGLDCKVLLEDCSMPCDESIIRKCFQHGSTENSLITAPNGRIWGLRAFPLQNDSGEVHQVMLLGHDVTEKIRLQAETIRTGQLAALGELAAGVAHEINNPINGIINFAQILVNRSTKAGQRDDIADRILREGDRIAAIVRNLLSFAQEKKEEKGPVVLSSLLQESLALCETQLRRDGVLLSLQIPRDIPCVTARPQQLEQVVLNLISNARHALNQKFPEPSPEKQLEISAETIERGNFVRLTFHDHGIGIPEGIRSRILNPFFSTKPAGTGTGLGLSVAHGIIQDHGGKLSIESSVDLFTKVHIDLPVARL